MISNGQKLFISDKKLIHCAETYGTPCYVYDLKFISNQWKQLTKVLPYGSELCYSVKANPNHGIISTLKDSGSHFDAASINEIETLLCLGVNPKKIYYIAPGKSISDVSKSIDNRIKAIVIDSSRELHKVVNISKMLGQSQDIIFRLNPGDRSHGSLSMTGTTQFGMSKREIIYCWNKLQNDSTTVKCIGLHCYQGTNILDANLIVREVEKVLKEFVDICEVVNEIPSHLNFGGGFGNPFSAVEHPIDMANLKTGITSIFSPYINHFKKVQYIFESGRYIVGSGGIFLTRIRDVKKLFKKKYVIVDGGIHCYGGLGRTGAFRPPPIRILIDDEDAELVTLCGPSCTPLDVLAHNIKLPVPNEGDLVAIYNAGAYQQTASPGRFLNFGFPKEVCIG